MTRRVTHLICVLGLAIATIGLASAPASAAALDFTVVDHRYCYVRAGGSNCHTPAILTTTCNWWYSTSAAIYIWNGSTWALVAWDHPGLPTSTC